MTCTRNERRRRHRILREPELLGQRGRTLGLQLGPHFRIEGLIPKSKGDLSYLAVTIGFRVYLIDF